MTVDINGALGSVVGGAGSKLASAGSSAFTGLIYFIFALIIFGIVGVVVYMIMNERKYNRRIIVFEKIDGRWRNTKKDKAMVIKFGATGDEVFFLKKNKKYLPIGEIQTGPRTYWYAIREDQEWINVGLEDIDTAMKQAKAKFLHTEMRAWRTSFQSNLKQRLEKPSFMEKYGTMVVSVVVLVVLMMGMYFVGSELVKAIGSQASVSTANSALLDKANQILSSLDNICVGSGIKVTKLFTTLI